MRARFVRFTVLMLSVGALVGSGSRMAAHHGGRPAGPPKDPYRLCSSYQLAYEDGYNSALQRQPMDTSWAAYCAPSAQQVVRDSWVAGYQAAVPYAAPPPPPPVVVAPRGTGYPSPVATRACRFASDCGDDGWSCRMWNHQKVCMGYGEPGAPCWFSSDCLSSRCDIANKTCR